MCYYPSRSFQHFFIEMRQYFYNLSTYDYYMIDTTNNLFGIQKQSYIRCIEEDNTLSEHDQVEEY